MVRNGRYNIQPRKVKEVRTMKRYIYSSIILISISGLLLGCDGKQRPLDNSPTETDVTNTESENTFTGNTQTTGASTGGSTGNDEQQGIPVVFSDIKPLFETHCIACHVEAASPPQIPLIEWLDYNTAKSYADNGKLKERVWDLRDDEIKGMPMANATEMTEEERKQIVKWIEDGGLQ